MVVLVVEMMRLRLPVTWLVDYWLATFFCPSERRVGIFLMEICSQKKDERVVGRSVCQVFPSSLSTTVESSSMVTG